MSLRTDFTGGLDTAINAAIAAGIAFGTTNQASISTALTNAAALGQTTVTFSANEAHNAAGMALEGNIWNAYKSGLINYFADQDIMYSEVAFTIATVDGSTNQVTVTFTF